MTDPKMEEKMEAEKELAPKKLRANKDALKEHEAAEAVEAEPKKEVSSDDVMVIDNAIDALKKAKELLKKDLPVKSIQDIRDKANEMYEKD